MLPQPFKAQFQGLDEVATLAKAVLAAVNDKEEVRVGLSNGTVLEGSLHPSLTIEAARKLVGSVLELEAAYKQLAVAAKNNWASVIKVFNTDKGREELFLAEALPFGATGSMYAFAKHANAIRKIGADLFGLLWTNFFDDYSQVGLESQGNDVQSGEEKCLCLLGRRFSMEQKKRKPAARKYDVLGATVSFLNSNSGEVEVTNKLSSGGAGRRNAGN